MVFENFRDRATLFAFSTRGASSEQIMIAEAVTGKLIDLVNMEQELEEIVGRPVDLIEKKGIEQSKNWIRRQEILNTAVPINLMTNELP